MEALRRMMKIHEKLTFQKLKDIERFKDH